MILLSAVIHIEIDENTVFLKKTVKTLFFVKSLSKIMRKYTLFRKNSLFELQYDLVNNTITIKPL